MFTFFTVFNLDASPPNAPGEDVLQHWVERATKGDREAASEIYRVSCNRVHRAIRPLCRNDADALDVVQDTFEKALQALPGYRPRAGKSFYSWLLTIALNTARRQGARSARLLTMDESPLSRLRESRQGQAESPEETNLEIKDALLHVLGKLSEQDRKIVCLRYGAEMTAEEIAQLFRMSAANVRKICERRRKTMLAELRAATGDRPIRNEREET